MAQAATMPPPLAAKEPRRSNRRSLPSTSTSTSKSSGSPSPDAQAGPSHKESEPSVASSRSGAASSATNGRSKRSKENGDEIAEERPQRSSNVGATKRGGKRRGKEKIKQLELDIEPLPAKLKDIVQEIPAEDLAPDEDPGITRCVCGVLDEDADTGEFMIQCEACKVWQHGPCMGFPSEDQAPQGDYYCEECKPEDHVELLKKLQRRQRQGSAHSHIAASRSSRSHSPSHVQKPSRRRNTMNSRDADILQEVLDASAAEAAAGVDGVASVVLIASEELVEEVVETSTGGRKKRKRVTEDAFVHKRKRSISSASEHPAGVGASDTHIDSPLYNETTNWPPPPPPPLTKMSTGRVKRGGNRKTAVDSSVNGDIDDGASHSSSRKHPNQYTYRGRAVTSASRRPPLSSALQPSSNNGIHEYGMRRGANQAGSLHPGTPSGSGSGAGAPRVMHHVLAVAQQPLFTSWNLPDYLAHLQTILPSEVPAPLIIRAPHTVLDEDSECATLNERGVKVKWPAKRMSVSDMNKRVRALSEWVGREQAAASERGRRKVALEQIVAVNQVEDLKVGVGQEQPEALKSDDVEVIPMIVDDNPVELPVQVTPTSPPVATASSDAQEQATASDIQMDDDGIGQVETATTGTTQQSRQTTIKMMEELMEELINFQERFGPGAKGRAKERTNRMLIVSA